MYGCPRGAGLRPAGLTFEVRLLGPVQAVRVGREIPLGGPRQRAVLALLLVDAGRVVPAGRLIEELWRGRAPPRGGQDAAVVCVAAAVGCSSRRRALVARGGGYAIGIDPGQLDAGRFERLVAEGQAAAEPGRGGGRG